MTQYYTIRHTTRFEYDAPIRESIMEVRVRPRDEGYQQCLRFDLSVSPYTNLMSYRDHLGNHVYHFDIPGTHSSESITADSVVRVSPQPALPDRLGPRSWEAMEQAILNDSSAWEMTLPSQHTQQTQLLLELADEIESTRHDDVLSTVRHTNRAIRETFEYKPQMTTAESSIDEALSSRAGVCQDFAHIMSALLRRLGIPCRYVSGYLYHRQDREDSLAQDDATHAWVEVLLPELGWVGFDPTNRTESMDHHIRTAVGRDYADVPPTRGVYRGQAKGTLSVTVNVTRQDDMPSQRSQTFEVSGWTPPPEPMYASREAPKPFEYYAQQMQQQQE